MQGEGKQPLAIYDSNQYMMNNYLSGTGEKGGSTQTQVPVDTAGSAFEDQIQFLIKKGILEDQKAEFTSFKRQNVGKWGTIS